MNLIRFVRVFIVVQISLLVALDLAPSTRGCTVAQEVPQPSELPSFGEPGISPDGADIAFVSGGDIWTVPTGGGTARLLVANLATTSRPLYSPDGQMLAFSSTRTGNGDIYLLTLRTGGLKRLTYDDAPEQVSGWSRDSRWIYFSSSSHDIGGMNDIYRIRVSGGTQTPVSADAYTNEFFAAPSPTRSAIAFSARGIASSQWWRKGHSHIDESEIWILEEGSRSYRCVVPSGAKQLWPMWTRDGEALYFVSDRSGVENLWEQVIGGKSKRITNFLDGRVLWPSIALDGKTIVFERGFGIWRLDAESGRVEQVRIERLGASASPSVQHLILRNQLTDLVLSPDGKKVAFTGHGQIFAAEYKKDGVAVRVTQTSGVESDITWSPNSRQLAYISDRDGTQHVYLYDFAKESELQLTHDAQADIAPRFSPDGKRLAFERGSHELRVMDLTTRQDRSLITAAFDPRLFAPEQPFAWSPDGRWIAFLQYQSKGFENASIVSTDIRPGVALEAHPISYLANSNADGIQWSSDGSSVFFVTSQRTEPGAVARVDVIPHIPKFPEDHLRALFKVEAREQAVTAGNDAGKFLEQSARAPRSDSGGDSEDQQSHAKQNQEPVEIQFAEIRGRLHLLPIGLDISHVTLSPDGKTVLLVADVAGQTNLYTYSVDDLSKEREIVYPLTSTTGQKSFAQFCPDGKEVIYLEDGQIQVVTLETRQSRGLGLSAELYVDFAREKEEVFQQVWTYLHDTFVDPALNGVDWPGMKSKYGPRVAGATTPDEIRRILLLMVGELDSSHTGIIAPLESLQRTTGRLGVEFDPVEYETTGRLRVTKIISQSPVALNESVTIGDELVAVDGQTIGKGTNLDSLLEGTIDKRVVLTVCQPTAGALNRDLSVRPISLEAEKKLRYRQWVEERRKYVQRISDGRLGYIHMFDMSTDSLAQLYLDLDSDNQLRDGIVIDIRNNNGGFVNAFALDVFARRPYLTMTTRGLFAVPARPQLGQRAVERPTILVTNQHSLSDAEDFAEGYRSLHLGKIVGEPTAGWIIYTRVAKLIDGSIILIPYSRISAVDGSPMEKHPRPVDVFVTRPLGESYTDRDSQLDRAVRELLEQIDSQTKR